MPAEGLERLVTYLSVTDDLITASSHTTHSRPPYARFDYKNVPCAWQPHSTDPDPWLQFDLGQVLTVYGVVIRHQCKEYTFFRVTSFYVSKSDDQAAWVTVSDVVIPDYTVNGTAITWFPQPLEGRFWRFHPVTNVGGYALKADLYGKPAGKLFNFLQLISLKRFKHGTGDKILKWSE